MTPKYETMIKIANFEIKKFSEKKFVITCPFLSANGQIKSYSYQFGSLQTIYNFLKKESEIQPSPDNKISRAVVEEYKATINEILGAMEDKAMFQF